MKNQQAKQTSTEVHCSLSQKHSNLVGHHSVFKQGMGPVGQVVGHPATINLKKVLLHPPEKLTLNSGNC